MKTSESRSDRLLIDVRTAARALSISERLLWSLTNDGTIPHVRLNRRVLYSPADLQRWIDQQKKGASYDD